MDDGTEPAGAPKSATIEAHGIDGTHGHPFAPLPSPDETSLSGAMWLPGSPTPAADQHVAFRGTFRLAAPATVEIRILAVTAYRTWIDGVRGIDGPPRFAPSHPQYQVGSAALAAGEHVLAVEVRSDALTTRINAKLAPFLWCSLRVAETGVEVVWRCRELTEYRATGLRISPLLGWVEWLDRLVDPRWTSIGYHDERLVAPAILETRDLPFATASACPLTLPVWPSRVVAPAAGGVFRETYTGYELDDLAIQIALADQHPGPDDDLDGVWQRYDLDRVRIGTLDLDVVTDDGGVVLVAYGERLSPHGTVVPVVPLSAGPTRMVQRFRVPGGQSTIEPMQSLGGRWIDVYVRGQGSHVVEARYCERDTLGPPVGRFECGDPQLERIWQVGVDTLRSSAEDAFVDSVRERGEWLGDVITAALEIAAVSHGDLRLVERGLHHAAASARDDGLVAGCGPGELIYLGTYAAQWVSACLRHAQVSGSTQLLTDLYPHASANVAALLDLVGPSATTAALPWPFVDWGHDIDAHQDIAVLLHLYAACRDWLIWSDLVRPNDDPRLRERCRGLIDSVASLVADRADLGYHSLVLATRAGLVPRAPGAKSIASHIERAFPWSPDGARLRSPTELADTVVTPYFMNYALPILLDAGQGEFVEQVWRRCWGWMLDRGATTWWEVFDDRWSLCHFWSGAPTWQMSRYLLGVWPRLHAGRPAIGLRLSPGTRTSASGIVASPAGPITVEWTRRGDDIHLHLDCPDDFELLRADGAAGADGAHGVRRTRRVDLHLSGDEAGVFRA